MARKIVVTSGKGGVGKTTVCCNLGVQLARRGCRVIVCDLDFGLNNADVLLGVENRGLYDLLDVIEGRCRPKQALLTHPAYPTLSVLSSNRVLERYLSPQAIRLVLQSLSAQYDYILLDSPAGIDDGFHRAAACADEALLVTTPHIFALRDADRVAGILKSYRFSEVGLAVNLVRKELVRRGDILAPEEIAEILRLPLVGTIVEDERLLIDPVSLRARGFRALAEHYVFGTEQRHKRGKRC